MKKLMIAVGIALIISGCSSAEENNSDSSNSSEVSSEVEMSSKKENIPSISESIQSSSDTTKDSTKPSGAGAGALEKSDNKESSSLNATTSEIPLVPQKSDIENGFTLENDPILQGVEERMRQAETIGIPNDVAIHFTGMTLNESEKTQAIFILVNLTSITMKNINMKVSFSNTAG